MRRTIVLALLIFLTIDITYGVATAVFQSPYGCSHPNMVQVTQQPNQTVVGPSDPNWQILAKPCFYVYYFGIIGGITFVAALFAPPRKRQEQAEELKS